MPSIKVVLHAQRALLDSMQQEPQLRSALFVKLTPTRPQKAALYAQSVQLNRPQPSSGAQVWTNASARINIIYTLQQESAQIAWMVPTAILQMTLIPKFIVKRAIGAA